MIKILILEDENVAARNLTRMLNICEQEIEVIDILDSKKDAITKLPKTDADLILMDIHLTDGSSFDIFEQIECNIPIIFATAYDQYTLQAFKHLSIDYLLKPITQNDLQIALNKYELHFKEKTPVQSGYQELIQLIKQPQQYKQRFLLQIGNKLKPIKTKEVAYFHSENKTTYLNTFNQRSYPIEFSLTQLENMLSPDDFYRVNRQYLIARKSITDITYLATTRLKVNLQSPNNTDVFVSIDRIVKFKNWLR